MKRALRATAAFLVVACLGGCATGESATPSTLPPLTVPGVLAVRGVSLREMSALTPAAVVTNDGGIEAVTVDENVGGIDGYPTLHWMLALSGVLDEIGDQPVTILAPSEAAFRDFKFVDYYGLMSNPVAMAPILRRHVVLGVYDIDALAAAGTVITLAGEQLEVWLNGRQLMVNEATLTPQPTPDDRSVGVTNLVVYEIDRVLLLPDASTVP